MRHARRLIVLLVAAALLVFAAGALARDGDDDRSADRNEVHNGRIVSFERHILTVARPSGRKLRGRVTRSTEIRCGVRAKTADHGDDDHGDDDDRGRACSTKALKAGARVREAELRRGGGRARWREVKLR